MHSYRAIYNLDHHHMLNIAIFDSGLAPDCCVDPGQVPLALHQLVVVLDQVFDKWEVAAQVPLSNQEPEEGELQWVGTPLSNKVFAHYAAMFKVRRTYYQGIFLSFNSSLFPSIHDE